MLTSSSGLAANVKQHFGVNRLDDQIMLADATIFEYALHKNQQPTLVFVDGLDEDQGQQSSLLNLIDKIIKFKVKVCLSSRYEKPFTVTFRDLAFRFRMDMLNRPGIYAYAAGSFETTTRPSKDRERQVLQEAAMTIAENSAGVFLRAQFAVSQVIDRVCKGHGVDDIWIHETIAILPSDLEQVYAHVFLSLNDEDKKTCWIVTQLIDTARRDLELPELFEASLLAGNNSRSLEKNAD